MTENEPDLEAEYVAWRDAPPAMLRKGDPDFHRHDLLARVAFLAGAAVRAAEWGRLPEAEAEAEVARLTATIERVRALEGAWRITPWSGVNPNEAVGRCANEIEAALAAPASEAT